MSSSGEWRSKSNTRTISRTSCSGIDCAHPSLRFGLSRFNQSPFFPASSSLCIFSLPIFLTNGILRQVRTMLPASCLSAPKFLQTPSTRSVRPMVTSQYSHTQLDTLEPWFPGAKSQNDVLKNVATNVPGRKIRVMAVISRISAP
jgi:hypothetical protein